jgi:hypothetical protein
MHSHSNQSESQEHGSPDHDSHEQHPASLKALPNTPSAFAARTFLSFLRASGHEDWAKFIAELPERVGETLGRPLNRVKEKVEKGEAISIADEKDLNTAIAEHPQEAAAALGLLLTHLVTITVDADTERRRTLDAYALVLNTICDVIGKAKTSVALRGFLHEANCVSYWHIPGRGNPEFSHLSDSLYPLGLEVYFIRTEPTPETLFTLNDTIRRNSQRRLPAEFYDYEHSSEIAKLLKIYETNITTSELHPHPDELTSERPDPFNLGHDPYKPMEFVTQIPSKAPNLIPMLESLFEARGAQRPPVDPVEVRTQLENLLKRAS